MLPYQVALVSDTSLISFSSISRLSAALQKQAVRDLGPVWGVSATVDGFERLEDVPIGYWPIIVRDDIQAPGAAGFHTDDNGQPFSLVQASPGWPLTASHECLEMLVDPFGNRTVAGAPPPQATGTVAQLERVVYLVEVCDPCESDTFAYPVNWIRLSDFITPHYYDPDGDTGVSYSLRGSIQGPHTVLQGGYVSFGDPITNEWFQIQFFGAQPETASLGVLQTGGRSLRETIDAAVRGRRRGYRTQPAVAAAAAVASVAGTARSSAGRAESLRRSIQALK
jgi:hypothetical protein